LYAISLSLVDYKKINFSLRIKVINHLMPGSFQYLIDHSYGKESVNVEKMKPYVRFYSKVVEFFPERSDGFSMLGYCYYALGEKARAVVAYQKALQIKPDFFWFNYNLALIYFKGGQFQNALPFLEKAVRSNLVDTFDFVDRSKVIYRSLLLEDPQFFKDSQGRYLRALQKSYEMLVWIYYQKQDFRSAMKYVELALNQPLPDNAFLYHYAGLVSYAQKEYRKAAQFFKKSSQVDKNIFENYQYWALCLKELKLEREIPALREYEAVLRKSGIQPTDVSLDSTRLQLF
jgi:tetratricopeptide (TPR) repeat protein